MTSKKQTLENQLGEVTFRKKLSEQHKGKKLYFEGQPTKDVILEEFQKRIEVTKEDFDKLLGKGLPLSPFLEIGAEKCQRAMFLVNKLGLNGFAADLSYESLKSARDFLKPLGFTKLPKRICLDAYHLPFRDNSIPLIFYYETLHHFPDPKPVLDEAYRVLRSDGALFFNDEPIKQLLNLH